MSPSARALALLVSLTILVGLAPGIAVGQDSPDEAGGQPTLSARIAETIDRIGAELGGTPAAAHEYVRNNVAFEPYEGVLRGDSGTFLNAAGNGADQALLMTSLIRAIDATAPLRYASCGLEAAVPAQLTTAVRASDAALLIDEAESIAAAVDDPELRAAILELAATREAIRSQAGTASDELAEALEAAGYPWGGEISATEAAGAPVEHVWLQARQDGAWIDLDATSQTGTPSCGPERTFETLPDSMSHHVRFRVVAEARTDGRLADGVLLEETLPTHELATARVALVFGEPMGLLAPSREAGFGLNPDLDAGLTSFTPLLRIDGRSIVGTPVAFPALGSFVADEVEDALGGAMDLFGELPGEEALEAEASDADGVTAIWLDISMAAPDGETVSVRSEVLDRIGVAARADGLATTAALGPLVEADGNYVALATLWQIGLSTGQVRTTDATLDGRLDAQTVDGLSGHLDTLLRTFPALRADLGAQTAGPAILLAGLMPTLSADGTAADSLVLDALHVPSGRAADIEQAAVDAQAAVAAEEMLVAFSGGRLDPKRSVGAVMRAAASAGTPLVLLAPDGDMAVPAGASDQALARVAARLADGQLLLLPAQAPLIDGESTLAWWSIDPLTGAIRDEHENGRHSSADTAAGEARTVGFMNHLRRFGCRVARPIALAATILYVSTGAGASPLHEVLEEVVQAAEAEAQRRAEREAAEKAACAGS